MKEDNLEKLKASGAIRDYSYHNVSDDGIVGGSSEFRNTELLLLRFPNGETPSIETYCSGTSENTGLRLEGCLLHED